MQVIRVMMKEKKIKSSTGIPMQKRFFLASRLARLTTSELLRKIRCSPKRFDQSRSNSHSMVKKKQATTQMI